MSYEYTNWNDGDLITAEKLNNIEQMLSNSDYRVLAATMDIDNGKWYVIISDILGYADKVFQAKRLYVATELMSVGVMCECSLQLVDSDTPVIIGTVFSRYDIETLDQTDVPCIYRFDTSEADNEGKCYLTRVDKWNEKFVVTLTPNSADYSGDMDKTPAEIMAAYNAEKDIKIRFVTASTNYADLTPHIAVVHNSGTPTAVSLWADVVYNGALIHIETDVANSVYATNIYPLST